MTIELGDTVESLRDFTDVPAGTTGVVIEDYGTGLTIAWNLPDRPIPPNRTLKELATMYAVNPECPLRDGFDKANELQYLKLVKKHPAHK